MIIISFILAEIAAYLTYTQFVHSPLIFIIPKEFALLLFVIPAVSLAFKRGFPFRFFTILIGFNIAAILCKSKIFFAILNTLYYFGYEVQAKRIYAEFSAYHPNLLILLLIVWLYVTAVSIEGLGEVVGKLKKRGVEVENIPLAYASIFAVSTIILIIFNFLTLPQFKIEKLFAGLIGIALLFAAAYLTAKSSERF